MPSSLADPRSAQLPPTVEDTGQPHVFGCAVAVGTAAWVGGHSILQGARRCLDVVWDTSLVPRILLRSPPSRFYLTFQGQRSCYSHLYQVTLDLLRADEVCLARSLRHRHAGQC